MWDLLLASLSTRHTCFADPKYYPTRQWWTIKNRPDPRNPGKDVVIKDERQSFRALGLNDGGMLIIV